MRSVLSQRDMSDSIDRVALVQAFHDLDRIHRRPPYLHRHTNCIVSIRIEFEKADRAVLLAECRTPHVQNVVQLFQVDGAVHAQVGPRALRQFASSLTSTVTVPFCTAGSTRITLPVSTPLWVSTDSWFTDLDVPRLRLGNFQLGHQMVRLDHLGQHRSRSHVLSDVHGISTSTPSIPARTFKCINCFCFNSASARIWSTLACCSAICDVNRLLAARQALVFQIISDREFVGLALGSLVGHAGDNAEIVERLVRLRLEFGLRIVRFDRGCPGFLVHEFAFQLHAQTLVLGLRSLPLQVRINRGLLCCELLISNRTVSGFTTVPGNMRMRTTVASVSAGICSTDSCEGTSVPMPRTCRSIEPRFTVSVQTVPRSTLGAAGLRRYTKALTAMTTTIMTATVMICRRRFFL